MSERPKGYADWSPRGQTLVVMQAVDAVLEEMRPYLPLTVRQIFYRLVGQYGYDKTEKAYKRLCNYLVRARRAEMIPFDSIRDDGTEASVAATWADVADFNEQIRVRAEGMTRDRMQGQEARIELWCEAAGMVPQLFRVASEYSVPVFSTGGFSSITVTYEIAQRALSEDKPTIFLHVGDLDPSGQSIFESMSADAQMFVEQQGWGNHELIPKRVALTPQQVEEFSLPTAPPKPTDGRSARWVGETCQAEALSPPDMAKLVEAAIVRELDIGEYRRQCDFEEEDRTTIRKTLS